MYARFYASSSSSYCETNNIIDAGGSRVLFIDRFQITRAMAVEHQKVPTVPGVGVRVPREECLKRYPCMLNTLRTREVMLWLPPSQRHIM